MTKFVSYEKCSKKERKARDAAKRGSWNGTNPVTRIVPSKKEYKRNPKHKGRIDGCAWGSSCIYCGEKIPSFRTEKFTS